MSEDNVTESMDVDKESDVRESTNDEKKSKNFRNKNELELEMDPSAYEMYHELQTGYPCLSFDILPSTIDGSNGFSYPLSITMVTGTNSNENFNNSLVLVQMDNMNRTTKEEKKKNDDDDVDDDESDSESESDDDDERMTDEKKPVFSACSTKHHGTINRIRSTKINGKIFCGVMSETSDVSIWNLNNGLMKLNNIPSNKKGTIQKIEMDPLFTFKGHSQEGYGIAWNHHTPGMLLTGDNAGRLFLWKPSDNLSTNNTNPWLVDQRSFRGHSGSVEDIQWSPTESTVFASCSVDKSIRIFDIRAPHESANMLTMAKAHTDDVNVISWNRMESHWILSGGDDNEINLWDLRNWSSDSPNNQVKCEAIAKFIYHNKPITSVDWHPTDSTTFAASSEDDRLTIWDICLEVDNIKKEDKSNKDIPPQLLFVHEGQKSIKELFFHKQFPGVILSTAGNGFNMFKTINV
ncbi:hypothetical protein SNEBB_004632 [Seison nebaliae]|nr:hypothetical protein SNEBB_004632 [Seison nebaliae]